MFDKTSEGIIMVGLEKDLDDILFENYICLLCGWIVQPNITNQCGCEEE